MGTQGKSRHVGRQHMGNGTMSPYRHRQVPLVGNGGRAGIRAEGWQKVRAGRHAKVSQCVELGYKEYSIQIRWVIHKAGQGQAGGQGMGRTWHRQVPGKACWGRHTQAESKKNQPAWGRGLQWSGTGIPTGLCACRCRKGSLR